ncbi:MAG: hypothetical protein ACJ8E3_04025 [Sphingomicrobium sp.]
MTKALFFAAAAVAALSAQVSAQQPAPAQSQGEHGGWRHAEQTRQQAQERAIGMFQRLDTNRDGALTREEAQKASLQMSSGGPRVERMMARLFGDAEALTQVQFETQALARFDRQDLNHDGTVTANERQQARAQRDPQDN